MMNLQWSSNGSVVIFTIFLMLTIAGLWFLAKAFKILDRSYSAQTGTHAFIPLFGITSFSLIWILFRQAVSLKIIIFTKPVFDLYFNAGIGLVMVILSLLALYKILGDAKKISDQKKGGQPD